MSQKVRLQPIDSLRGLIIILMALDHANYFIAQKHSTGEYFGGAFPTYSDALPFITRLITHLAAPGFFLLMGVGMVLFANSRREKGWDSKKIIGHFIIRGIVLILLQFLLINKAWELSPNGWNLDYYIGVLFALGGTMIIGSFFVDLKPKCLFGLAFILFIGTEFLSPDPNIFPQIFSLNSLEVLKPFLWVPGSIPEIALWSNYQILPWLELVILGLAFGKLFIKERVKTYKLAFSVGIAFLISFVIIRSLDGIGNIRPMAGNSWIDYLNVVKYPPSITFTLLTTGINLVLLFLFSKIKGFGKTILNFLRVFGQVPLFFYITHLFFYWAVGYLLFPQGLSIEKLYPAWILLIIVQYPFCIWFRKFKYNRPIKSVWRYL